MNRSLKLVLLVFSVLLFSVPPCGEVHSCGFYPEWDDSRILFFNPALSGDETLKPFYYTQHLYFGRMNALDENTPKRDYRRNCQEWQAFLGESVKLEDVEKVIFGSPAEVFINGSGGKGLDKAFPNNTFIRKLLLPENRDLLKYLHFAKDFEFQQVKNRTDPWEEQSPDMSAFYLKTLETASAGLQSADNDFLKQRWAYQLIITSYYAEKYADIPAFYNQYFKSADASILKYWALLKVAETEPDSLKANYMYSRVFSECDSKRLRAGAMFRSRLADATLALAQNAEEKATIITMRAMQYPGRALADIQKIQSFSPASPYLSMLIVREINKLEDWLLSDKLTGFAPFHGPLPDTDWNDDYYEKMNAWRAKNLQKDWTYLREFRSFLETSAANTKAGDLQNLLNLAVAHLYLIDNTPAKTRIWLDKIAAEKTPDMALQKTLEEILLLPALEDINAAAVQEKLVQQLLSLRKQASRLSLPTEQLGRVYLWLSHAFYHKKNIAVAGLFFNRSWVSTSTNRDWSYDDNYRYESIQFFDNLASVTDIDTLIGMIAKPKKSAFESFLTSKFERVEFQSDQSEKWFYDTSLLRLFPVPDRDRLLDLQGTVAFRENNFEQAMKSFSRMPADYWEKDGAASEYLNLDFFELPDTFRVKASKAAFVKKLLALENEAKQNPQKASDNYYKIAQGLYETSYFGAGWYMTSYGYSLYSDSEKLQKRDVAHLNYLPDPARYGADYFHCERAKTYARKALAAKPIAETGSKAMYLLALIDQHERRFAYAAKKDGTYKDVGRKVQSPLFLDWKKKYAGTRDYAEKLSFCSDLRYYLGR